MTSAASGKTGLECFSRRDGSGFDFIGEIEGIPGRFEDGPQRDILLPGNPCTIVKFGGKDLHLIVPGNFPGHFAPWVDTWTA